VTPAATLRRAVPAWLFRYLLSFEAGIEEAVAGFARSLPHGARVLDAGAGEGQYRGHFHEQRYCGLDLGIGDREWNYAGLDVIGDLSRMPFRAGAFDAVINIVTLEHLCEPAQAVQEMQRVLCSGGRVLIVAPQDWEVHQAPHDYFRYTRYGLRYLLESAGFTDIHVFPMGGFFRVVSRRLLTAPKLFRGWWRWLLAPLFTIPALVLPLLDSLDPSRDFTLGYTCTARKP